MPWRQRAACRGTDPEVFFPLTGPTPPRPTPPDPTRPFDRSTRTPAPVDHAAAARAVCRACPVIDDCRTFAITTRATAGVWAGLDTRQLEQLIRARSSSQRHPGDPGAEHPGDDELTVAVSHPHRDVVVLRVTGEIDMLTAPLLARALAAAHQDLVTVTVERGGPAPGVREPRLVCDLGDVGFLAASGLAVLAEAVERARRHHIGLVVVADTRLVRHALEITGLDRCVPVEHTLMDAITRPPRRSRSSPPPGASPPAVPS